MATFTVSHRPGDRLADLLTGLTRAWGVLTKGRRWALAQDRSGLVGWLRSVEVTVGPSGWHPHLHVVVLLQNPGVEADLADWLTERWRDACQAAGLRVPSRARGVDVRDVGQSAAGYLVAITTEAVRADIKAGRVGGSYGALQLLDLAGTPLERWARSRWREYETTVHGRHAMAYSRGIRRWVAQVKTSDFDAPPDITTDPVAAMFSGAEWSALRCSPTGLSNVLALLDAGRSDHVAQLRAALFAPEPRPTARQQ